MYEERIERAHALFMQGYNCAQSVTAAFADMYGFSEEQALKMSASFGGGIGRMRLTCGAACGLFLLAGLETGVTDPNDREGKGNNYAVVRELSERFRQQNGSITCGELLGLTKPSAAATAEGAMPAERTQEYYKKRPCAEIVRGAAQIFADYLAEKAVK